MSDLTAGARSELLAWYELNRRDLPWRRTSDTYAIWVSEAMLQQTQVATVERYWKRWIERFPTIEALAAANEQDALAEWQGLGYYRRCRMLLAGARALAGRPVPTRVDEWRSVPGVGRYTAGAIASIAQGVRAAVVDGNVERVYSRLTGDGSSGSALNRNAWNWAERQVDEQRPGEWNQALMELGATVCLPVGPRCGACPLRGSCAAYANGPCEKLPMKTYRAETIYLSQEVWVPWSGGRFGVRQIAEGQWWEGMWEFPRSERGQRENLSDLVGECELLPLPKIRHSVTRHRIQLAASLALARDESPSLVWKSRGELSTLPMPSPQRKALRMALDFLAQPSLAMQAVVQ